MTIEVASVELRLGAELGDSDKRGKVSLSLYSFGEFVLCTVKNGEVITVEMTATEVRLFAAMASRFVDFA